MRVTRAPAQLLKQSYIQIRDRLLKAHPEVQPVKLLVEPQDDLEVGAWPTKVNRILGVVKKEVHFEFPLYNALRTERRRNLYRKY